MQQYCQKCYIDDWWHPSEIHILILEMLHLANQYVQQMNTRARKILHQIWIEHDMEQMVGMCATDPTQESANASQVMQTPMAKTTS